MGKGARPATNRKKGGMWGPTGGESKELTGGIEGKLKLIPFQGKRLFEKKSFGKF